MTARSEQREAEAEWFTSPQQVNQRRYEALRGYFVAGLSYAEAGARFGYTRWAMINLVREHRAGKLELFDPPRRPGPEASMSPATPGRDANLPAAAVIDFGAWPERLDTTRAGLLLAIPDLVSLDLPALIKTAGYPGTRVIPAVSWLLSLLALKLTRTRRVSHVDDLLADPAAALLAGLAVLPKKTALTDYSYRLLHDHQQRFLAALDKQMISGGLATSEEAIFDLDFHAILHWGRDPVLEKHPVWAGS